MTNEADAAGTGANQPSVSGRDPGPTLLDQTDPTDRTDQTDPVDQTDQTNQTDSVLDADGSVVMPTYRRPLPESDFIEPAPRRHRTRKFGAWRKAWLTWSTAFYAWADRSAIGRFTLVWGAPLAITLLAGIMRFAGLGSIHKLIFDETYYVKDAYSYTIFGYERAWPDVNDEFVAGNMDLYETNAGHAVHPPVGKWMIALGMYLFGPESSTGWRFSSALFGTISILILILVARRLFRSQLMGCLAGLFMTLDGEHLVHSRTGLLDLFLMFWALVGFWLFLLDRDQMRRRLAARVGRVKGYDSRGRPIPADGAWGPGLGMRWYLLAAGVAFGLATGVKWSGVYFLAAFGILTVCWDVADRRAAGVRRWLPAGVLRDGGKAFICLVPIALATYLASWIGWFKATDSWGRQWAAEHPDEKISWLPDALASWLHYHQDTLQFHVGLTTDHTYKSNPLGWLLQWRPTSFFWEKNQTCGAADCSQAITSIGNPMLWLVALAGLGVVLYYAVVWAERRSWAILAGYLGGYVPWLFFMHRTIFTFYTVAFTPFVVLATCYLLWIMLNPQPRLRRPAPARRTTWRRVTPVVIVAVIVVAGLFWLPIWTAWSVPHWFWQAHIWLTSWI